MWKLTRTILRIYVKKGVDYKIILYSCFIYVEINSYDFKNIESIWYNRHW